MSPLLNGPQVLLVSVTVLSFFIFHNNLMTQDQTPTQGTAQRMALLLRDFQDDTDEAGNFQDECWHMLLCMVGSEYWNTMTPRQQNDKVWLLYRLQQLMEALDREAAQVE